MYKIRLVDTISKNFLNRLPAPVFQIDDQRPDALLTRSSVIKDSWITPELLAISRAGVGTNTINRTKATANGTIIMNTPGINANAVKELVLACLLTAVRPIFQAQEMVQSLSGPGLLEQAEAKRSAFVGQELQGKTVGLLGLGAIGKEVARICYELGMDVLGYSRNTPNLEYIEQVSLENVLRYSDFVIVMLPLTEETKYLLNKERLSLMKKEAVLINVGRGEIVQNEHLLEILNEEKLSRYITDFPNELFLGNEKVFMLPHIGGSTQEALADSSRAAIQALRNFLLFGTVRDSVNFPSVRLVFRSPYRLTVFYERTGHTLTEILRILDKEQLLIGDMTRNHKEDYIYTLINIESTDKEKLIKAKQRIEEFPEVKRVRLLQRPAN
ncbi:MULTISPECIES: NAD(P)-dependent oxidoreductase [unclassified Enterococcus]|jgi:D-3-phosphoglycerate dehydrogenase|uniref:NAD(P)-dependent oxidoreductase n=1 Tax=unclassified Enterococcus TaxID=2608891 RepID=UPI003D29242F